MSLTLLFHRIVAIFLFGYFFNLRYTANIDVVAWHSGTTSVFGWRTFSVPTSTCIRRVTMVKLSAAGQPNRPTQPFILSGR